MKWSQPTVADEVASFVDQINAMYTACKTRSIALPCLVQVEWGNRAQYQYVKVIAGFGLKNSDDRMCPLL